MSFQISLQKNTSPPNFVTKSITDVAYATGVLREGTSIIDPTFLIETELSSDMISNVNYLYCAEFGRYYYVTNIIAETGKLWSVHCHVDVLMSYASQIKAQTAVVARQTNQYNMMLDDGWFMAYQDPIIQTKYLSEEAPFEHQEFVLVVAGN